MKVKLTPLNIVSAVCIVFGVWLLLDKAPENRLHKAIEIQWLMPVFFFLSAVIAFGSDLVFRRLIPELKKLWITEGVLVIFILFLLIL